MSRFVSVARSPLTRTFATQATSPTNQSKYWLLHYDYVDAMLDRRVPHRPSHLKHATAAVEQGKLLLGGAHQPGTESVHNVVQSNKKSSSQSTDQTASQPIDQSSNQSIHQSQHPTAATLVFHCDREYAESFASNDPYVLNGLVTQWRLTEWTVVVGSAMK